MLKGDFFEQAERALRIEKVVNGESLYERCYSMLGMDDGLVVFAGPRVKSWPGWPADVRPLLQYLNRSAIGQLSFTYRKKVFFCPVCSDLIEPRGATVSTLSGMSICDDCLVEFARSIVKLIERSA